jgi:hypothetical protein
MIKATGELLDWLRSANLQSFGVKFIIEAPDEETFACIVSKINDEIEPLRLKQGHKISAARDLLMKMNGFDFVVRRPSQQPEWLKRKRADDAEKNTEILADLSHIG